MHQIAAEPDARDAVSILDHVPLGFHRFAHPVIP
jgi:hypothetical protein